MAAGEFSEQSLNDAMAAAKAAYDQAMQNPGVVEYNQLEKRITALRQEASEGGGVSPGMSSAAAFAAVPVGAVALDSADRETLMAYQADVDREQVNLNSM